MRIGYLQMLQPSECFRYTCFQDIAKQAGAELEFVRVEDASDLSECSRRFDEILNEADAFLIPDDTVFFSREMTETLHSRIAAGARAIVLIQENCLDRQNAFLSRYDMVGTRIRIRSRTSPLLSFSRESEAFRDFRLFAGIEQVQAQQPNAIWYGGESSPLLVGTAETGAVVSDGATDFLTNWNARELASMAAWHSQSGGGVISLAGNFFADAYTGATGIHCPGIEVNEGFARNVLTYLSEGRPSDTPDIHCKRIEINLADFVLNRLKSSSQDWWNELVPEKIREKCKARAMQEFQQLPIESYLDLIDLKVLMEKNWELFASELPAAGCEGGKNSALGWMNKLNELRRFVGHPLKKHVSGYNFTSDDRALLKSCDELARTLAKAVAVRPHEKG